MIERIGRQKKFYSRTVLLVDDEQQIRSVTRAMLEILGCRVVCCDCGDEALCWLRRNGNADAMVTDIDMPEMDGIELADEAGRIVPDLPVVFCSGGSRKSVRTAGGCRCRLSKPFTLKQLEQALSRVIVA
ncbi:MAG: response regulator [Polyangia bacterium]